MKRVVLDASAVMAFFENRPGAEKVEDLINRAVEEKVELLMSMVSWGEVYYSVWRARGKGAAEEKLRFLGQLPIEIVPPEAELTKLAASFRAQHKLLYADCFVAALAKTRKAELLTADADFALVKHEVQLLKL